MATATLPWVVRLLALAAVVLSAFLWWSGLQSQGVAGCDVFGAFDCDAALASPWAKWLGLPVALGGLACYLVALTGSALAGRRGGLGVLGWRLLEGATLLAVGAGIWFTVVQAAFLGALCLYCVATHLTGLALAIAACLWRRQASRNGVGPVSPLAFTLGGTAASAAPVPPKPGLPTLAASLGLVSLIVGQTVLAPSQVSGFEADLAGEIDLASESAPREELAEVLPGATAEPAAPEASARTSAASARRAGGSRTAAYFKGRLKIDAYEHAVLGSPDAPHLVLEMMDYACPHCREFHEKLHEALERFQGQVAVVVMPVPGEISCNPYVATARAKSAGACYAAKLSMAVSRLAPEEFPSFHEWMLRADAIPSRTASLIEARSHVDGDDLSRLLRDDDGSLAGRVKRYVELAAQIGRQQRFGLPAQVIGDKVFAGPMKSTDELCGLWARELGLEEPRAEIPF